ncbi:hypothetical protein LV84_03710 [Algoriphagus ratkowskyi]|uniref:DUF2933 domain-containing protein n=1 Tax=Algoriphagus ratkowskyi TaxID=57028 RepID=A0A2W7QSJ9_9BACT|nr:hypothetical protein LV84_03710 [Algoriphagus ratkowskyi]TXD78831.1 hypothetical protein ESW18_04735 [Algoriphagus ratkowskyi]
MRNNHMTWMLVGCLGIFLLLFLLPVFGFNGTNSLFIFAIIFFVAHLFMMRSHGGHGSHSGHDNDQKNQSKNKNDHATHQH